MAKKRKPGAGRKPQGPGKPTTFSTRIDEQLRLAIEAEAKDRGSSISNTTADLLRLGLHTRRERQDDKPTQALCFLISELARLVSNVEGYSWHSNPFMFESLKLAIPRLMETFRPDGPIEGPSVEVRNSLARQLFGPLDTPEKRAEHTASMVAHMVRIAKPRSGDPLFPDLPADWNTGIERTSDRMWSANQTLLSGETK